MKKTFNNLFSQISDEQLKNLTSTVKETLAYGINNNSSKVFTAADLWNIQRNKRNIGSRRFI